jgi:hypothetical protein
MGLSGHRVLPLFEGVGPPTAYRWVKPPPQFAASNIKPASYSGIVAIQGGSNGAAAVQTSDAQFVVTLSPGAFVGHGTDTGVQVTVNPLDPATLGPPPAGLKADGNAYRITLAYAPSGAPVPKVNAPSNVVMIAPHGAKAMLFSPDGQRWQKLSTIFVGGPTAVGATFEQAGWYLVGLAGSGSSDGASTVRIAIGAAAGAAVVGLIGLAIRARRARTATPAPARKPPPPPQKRRKGPRR